MKTGCLIVLLSSVLSAADTWPQFRGPNGSGISDSGRPPISLDGKPRWTADVPSGHSSPAVAGDRIFLSAYDPSSKTLELLALNYSDGRIVWRRPIPAPEIEKVHEISSPATATPVTDGKRVFAYFGSYGLLAFDLEGKQLWTLPLPLPKMSFGSGTSPVLAGDRILLSRDEAQNGYLLSVSAADGKQIWKYTYTTPGRFGAYATPVIWNNAALIHRATQLVAVNLEDGKERWVKEISSEGTSVPLVGKDLIYVAAWSPFGEEDHLPPVPGWDEIIKNDKDGDGKLNKEEFPENAYLFKRPNIDVTGSAVSFKMFFGGLDTNKDGAIDRAEWQTVLDRLKTSRRPRNNGLMGFKPDGEMVWKIDRSIPEVSSPLLYRDHVYMIVNGGIVTCADAQSGKLLYRERLGVPGGYFASPVAANGHVYFSSMEGIVTVIKDLPDKIEVVAKHDFGEPLYASPAIVGNGLLIRTAKRLYAYGE